MPPPNIAHGFVHPFEVFKISWWMRHYDACTPKRHVGLCNNVWFDRLNLGKLTKKDKKGCTTKTVVKYVSKSGRPSYKGTSALKSTQFLARISGLYLYLSMQGFYEKQNWILGWTPYYPLYWSSGGHQKIQLQIVIAVGWGSSVLPPVVIPLLCHTSQTKTKVLSSKIYLLHFSSKL